VLTVTVSVLFGETRKALLTQRGTCNSSAPSYASDL